MRKEIHLALELRKCTQLYHYYMHPDFGLCPIRVQTWFPFTVKVCLNEREWPAHHSRYLEALASVTGKAALGQACARVCRPVTIDGVHDAIISFGPKCLAVSLYWM